MIPVELKAKWIMDCDRREIVFLADHGGGWPDVLAAPGLDVDDRLDVLRGLGFKVAERYEMEGMGTDNDMWPWVRLTNDIAVCLQDGFVSRHRERRPRKRRYL